MSTDAKRRLLLVDDDHVSLSTLSRQLLLLGYETQTADSAAAATRLCESARFDLALVDIRMPGVDGLEFARILGERWSIPCVFLSAHSDPRTVEEARERGAMGYLVKPVAVAQLLTAIETAIARARDEHTLREQQQQLAEALSASRETSIAVGILMARERLDRAAAFEMLRQRARAQRRKVADISNEVVRATESLAFGNGNAPKPQRDTTN